MRDLSSKPNRGFYYSKISEETTDRQELPLFCSVEPLLPNRKAVRIAPVHPIC